MKRKVLLASLKDLEDQEIYLNITFLQRGTYHLKIIDKKDIVQNTHFIKK